MIYDRHNKSCWSTTGEKKKVSYSRKNTVIIMMWNHGYLEKHELHEFVDMGLQDLNNLLVDLATVGLLIALHLSVVCTAFSVKLSQSPKFSNLISHGSKAYRRLEEPFLIRQNRTKRANVWGSPLFQATYNNKTEKQTINSTYSSSVGYRRKERGIC